MKDVKASSEALLQEGPPASKRVRGLRDVMSSRKVAGRSVPTNRSQQLSEIAWLDRELERLRREASIMDANLQRINARVLEVGERRDSIVDVIRRDLGLEFAAETPVQPKPQRVEEEVLETDEISLEY